MGRGRQKAKDAKIARELKYTNHGGDLRALERELIGGAPAAPAAPVAEIDPEDDLYDRWADDEDDDLDEDEDER
jgi:hypothetical protein